MNEQINDGGAAFPSIEGFENRYGQLTARGGSAGMTLRDYFAAKAMVVMLANESTTYETDAERAYKAADAMLRARALPQVGEKHV